ncbi:MAG: protein kinase [Verrucomicrobia bacterium]|nr:protein kinase [Verrucomicrobiota bacterium]
MCLIRHALDAEPGEELGAEAGSMLKGEGRFDHYELLRRGNGTFDELGRGAMGITYRARDTVLGHAVALKVLDARIASRPQARERFLREARAAARLRHPNVAAVFYYGVRQSDGQCFYTMELVEGESVEARVRRTGLLETATALKVVAQVARALVAAERQGVVHRDLKPSNLMLVNGPELTVKVIDFGLAKAPAADETNLTQGGFVGTPAFASPEQFAGGYVDVRSDLYSLGVTLWEMLSGQAPFRGSRAEVMGQHLHAPLPLEQLKGQPQPAVALVQKLLEKDPARRFQSPTQLLKMIPMVTAAINPQRTLTGQGSPKKLPAASSRVSRKPPTRPGPKKISVARLPVTGGNLFGREEELTFLDDAWANPQTNAVTIVAWAGVGKSTLVNHWLRRMAIKRYRSAELVFGWSFYRQGTRGDVLSADEFLDAALAWFGDPDPRVGTAWEKGERLARLIAYRRTLLVLDGLEPLQNPPGPQEGRLREPSLQALLRELASFNRGLCVITTRLPVTDFAEHEGGSAVHRDLDHLSAKAGAQLLRALGVKGSEEELCNASEEFGGHSLALTLLGSYLADAYDGDIRHREGVSRRLADDVRQGVHARRVMISYQSWFGEGAELSVLRLLGLFDRPADEKALRALLNPPAIRGLTEPLSGLSPTEWRSVLARLRRARLLAEEDPQQPGQSDAHPLVREYFGEQLRSEQTPAWQEANRRLYEYYRALAPPRPDSFRDMEPLFLAVIFACRAGLLRDALHEVYLPRIQRGNASFAAKALGVRGALVSALAHFFENGRWGALRQTGVEGQSLTAEDQLFIFIQAALYLSATRGLGAPESRICYERAEALSHVLNRPLTSFSALIGQWRYSLMTDKLTATMQIARRVHALAQELNDPVFMIGAYQSLAATLYYMGDFEFARNHARRGIELWSRGGISSPVEEVDLPAVNCLCLEALSDWHLGEMAACQTTMAEAISLAKSLKDTHALAAALFHAGCLGQFEHNPAAVEGVASDLIELSTHQSFAIWLTGGQVLRGWARVASGRIGDGLACIEQAMQDLLATGTMLNKSYALAVKAEALHLADRTPQALEAIKEAQAVTEMSEERWWCAELHRLRGVFLAATRADEVQIEAAFSEAIRTAKRQKSTSLVNRAEAAYAEYCCQRPGGSPDREGYDE